MPLEATIIIVDNSEYMRNGDYHPDRFRAQADAVTTLFQTKVDSNPENTVGFMTMAGKGCAPYTSHQLQHVLTRIACILQCRCSCNKFQGHRRRTERHPYYRGEAGRLNRPPKRH